MPGPLLHAYAAMLPRLQAGESVRRVTEIAVGTGSVAKQEQRRILADWERRATGPRPQRPDTEGAVRQLAAWGIPVRQEAARG